ncbi:MAG: glucosyltransferase domain-containing protein [Lachnospiraceae bacterium]|nr:glucosyltransferase domain-containing protein [Lachnospiraceae bacterium]
MLSKNPIEWCYEKGKRIAPPVRWTFAMTFLVGILVHFYSMSHKFFNYFEMGNIFSYMPFLQEDTVGLGRWFMPIATNLFTSFSMPVFNTLICLLYMSLASALIVDLLEIRSRAYAVMFGLVFVTFPGLTCVLSYGVNCDEITLALLLSILAGYAFYKWKYGIVWGALLLCLSLGAYQPYMSATIGVVYMMLFMKAFREKNSWKEFSLSAIRAVVMLAAGFLLYYIILQITIAVTGAQLSDYHGVDNMTSFTPKGLAKGLVYTYGYFLSYFFTTAYTYTVDRIVCNVIGAAAFMAALVRRLRTPRDGGEAACTDGCSNILLVLLLCFLPLGVNAAPFLMADRVGAGVDRYMIFSLMFLWALLLAMLDACRTEKLTFMSEKRGNLVQWAGALAVSASILSGFLICNQAYHRMEAMTETTGALLNRIAARMEETPEWNKDMPVYFVNCRALVNEKYEVEIPEYEAIRNMPGTFLRSSYSEEAIVDYLEVYLHFPVREATQEQREAVEKTPEFARMESYPAQSSVQVIDGVMVVKISEGEEY